MPPPPATPSQSLRNWTTTRQGKLSKSEARCVWAIGLAPPDPDMVDEHLRAYAMLLSAHFQAYCRDLYTEASQAVIARIRQKGLNEIVQAQLGAGLVLDRGNPTLDALEDDFSRFGVANFRSTIGTGPPADGHKRSLGDMIACRNKCAHGKQSIPELQLANIRDWRHSCDWLASRLNAILYDVLWRRFRSAPW